MFSFKSWVQDTLVKHCFSTKFIQQNVGGQKAKLHHLSILVTDSDADDGNNIIICLEIFAKTE
jgi:hypothetical protein